MWLIADPTGTVGALGRWGKTRRASGRSPLPRGRKRPMEPAASSRAAMGTLFTTAIDAPWCYLEFGDVSWCRDPAAAGSAFARGGRCGSPPASSPRPAAPHGRLGRRLAPQPESTQARALEHSAELLRDARSNGAIFLALPAKRARA